MALVYLVRHAKPAGGWGDAEDPGLNSQGVAQARAVADEIAALAAPLALYTSPMRRCRETAAPLAQRWGREVLGFPELSELPSPPLPLPERAAWLRSVMPGSWNALAQTARAGWPDFIGWRERLVQSLARLREDSVVFTHYIGINAVVGAARGSDDVQGFRPDHASVTVVRFENGRPVLAQLGREVAAATNAAPLLGK